MNTSAIHKSIVRSVVIFSFIALQCPQAFALPSGEQVVSGSANFDRSQANQLTVTTPSQRLIVNYGSFNIAQPETVNFVQPSSNSVALNRVTGADPSDIEGHLSANGQVFLINPNGVLFGPSAQVNAPGLLASTLDIRNSDFLTGNYRFFQNGGPASITNYGNIHISQGGYAALLSNAVDNQGAISAYLGKVALAAGEKMTVTLNNADPIAITVDRAVRNAVSGKSSAINNSGSIQADGGRILLSAKTLNGIFDQAVNNTGVVQANSLVNHDGQIELAASGGRVDSSGLLAAGLGQITFNSRNGVNQSGGQLITNNLLLLGNGGFNLKQPDNILQILAADIRGSLNLNTSGTLLIGNLGTTVGVTTHGGNVRLTTGNILSLAAPLDVGSGSILLDSANGISGAYGSLLGNQLILRGSGVYYLIGNNDVGSLSANVNGLLMFNNLHGLSLGNAGGGINTHNNDLTVWAQGPVGIVKNINSGRGQTLIQSNDAVYEDGAGITADTLVLSAGNQVSLFGNANYVNHLSADVRGFMTFNDQRTLNVGTDAYGGINTGGQDLNLQSAGRINITKNINANTIILDSYGGGISEQGNGALYTARLVLFGGGVFNLQGPNAVSELAGNIVGSLNLHDVTSLFIGNIYGTAGVTTNNAGNLRISSDQSIQGGPGSTLSASKVFLNAVNGIGDYAPLTVSTSSLKAQTVFGGIAINSI